MAEAPRQLCGRPTEAHNRHVRFRVPDVLVDHPGWERGADVWMSHEDPNASVMMQVADAGPFVPCLLPVHLTGGFTVTSGAHGGWARR